MRGSIIISKKVKITIEDFTEVINTWNTFYSYHLSCANKDITTKVKTDRGLLKVAKSLYVPEELYGTSCEVLLDEAVKLAEENDLGNLPKIYAKLRRLENILAENA